MPTGLRSLCAVRAVQAVLRACPRLRLAPDYTPEWKALDSLHCLTTLHVCTKLQRCQIKIRKQCVISPKRANFNFSKFWVK